MTLKRAVIIFSVIYIASLLLLASFYRPSRPDLTPANIDGIIEAYEQRLDQAESGLAWYKKLSEKKVEPVVVEKHVGLWRDRFFPLPGIDLKDSLFYAKNLNFEYPFFIRNLGETAYVSTYNASSESVRLYAFGNLGRQWDLAFTPGSSPQMFTSNDWVVFNGLAIGGGAYYDLALAVPYASVKGRVTFFKRVELEVSAKIPQGLSADIHYFF